MKKILLFTFVLLIILNISGQSKLKLEYQRNAYHAGDKFCNMQVEYENPGNFGVGQKWDFSKLKVLNEKYQVKYFLPDTDTTKICCMEHKTRYYYNQSSDSLWSTGFENNTTIMKYVKPELKLVFPFTYGDTLYSYFEGIGTYCNMIPLKVKGYTHTAADAEGEIKLPDSVIINNVLRTHSMRHYTEVGRDSSKMTLDTYSWYAPNIRYPIFESVKTTINKNNKDTLIFFTSFCCSTEKLKGDIKNALKKDSTSQLDAREIFTDAEMLPNPVTNFLTIQYKLTRKAAIWFSVHNNLGVLMCKTDSQILDEGNHQELIPMSNLLTGTYLVYAHVDNSVIKSVIIKK